MKKYFLAIALLLVVCSAFMYVKSFTIKGKVVNDLGQPIAQAMVVVKGSSKSINTNSDGLFSIVIPQPKSVLVVHAFGYEDKEVVVVNDNFLTIQLKSVT